MNAELELTNEQLNTDMERLLDEAMVDQAQEQAVEREFTREYQVITRDGRLEKIDQVLRHEGLRTDVLKKPAS